jgi:cellulose synthase/poly-beta-1,6-N-acetylglucosamine synthase-like glycosyltransferase
VTAAAVETLLCLLALLVLIPVSVVFVQVLMALPELRPRRMQAGRRPSIAVLVPAHNEASVIASTLRTIAVQVAEGDRMLVVADNCTDDTAKIALEAGAEVVQRCDFDRRGKGYALDFGVRHLERNPPEAVLVIDADCTVAPGTVERLARLCIETGRPVQGLDLMVAPSGAGLRTRVMEFAWLVRNQVRALGFHRLGLPCQLMGTGMAFPWPVIRAAAFASGHIVEDLQLGIDLTRAGRPPLFCPEARVTSYFARTPAGIAAQRTRWEHGHLGMILGTAPRLLLEARRGRDWNLLALSLDLSVPPLAFLTLLVLMVFAASTVCAMYSMSRLPLSLASVSLMLLGSSVLLSWGRYGRQVLSLAELAFGPMYALSKIPLYLRFLVRRQSEWVRATRDGD